MSRRHSSRVMIFYKLVRPRTLPEPCQPALTMSWPPDVAFHFRGAAIACAHANSSGAERGPIAVFRGIQAPVGRGRRPVNIRLGILLKLRRNARLLADVCGHQAGGRGAWARSSSSAPCLRARAAPSRFPAFTVGPIAAIMRTGRPVFHIVRSIAGVSSMFLNFAALMLLPLADITAFSFVAPIFAVVLAALAPRPDTSGRSDGPPCSWLRRRAPDDRAAWRRRPSGGRGFLDGALLALIWRFPRPSSLSSSDR